MRVAFVGKGGAGKSSLAGTFARMLARRSEHVVAVDSDPMPGLAFALGIDVGDAPIPDDAVVEKAEGEEGPRYRLRPDLTPVGALDRYGHVAPDGVRFLQFGKARGATTHVRAQFAFRQIVSGLIDGGWSLVGDLPGGTRQPFFGWGDYARVYVVVVEPTAKSMLSARRLRRLADAGSRPAVVAVANKVRHDADVERVAACTGLDVVASVPWDEALAEADRLGRPLIEHAPESSVVRAIGSLVDRLEGMTS